MENFSIFSILKQIRLRPLRPDSSWCVSQRSCDYPFVCWIFFYQLFVGYFSWNDRLFKTFFSSDWVFLPAQILHYFFPHWFFFPSKFFINLFYLTATRRINEKLYLTQWNFKQFSNVAQALMCCSRGETVWRKWIKISDLRILRDWKLLICTKNTHTKESHQAMQFLTTFSTVVVIEGLLKGRTWNSQYLN